MCNNEIILIKFVNNDSKLFELQNQILRSIYQYLHRLSIAKTESDNQYEHNSVFSAFTRSHYQDEWESI